MLDRLKEQGVPESVALLLLHLSAEGLEHSREELVQRLLTAPLLCRALRVAFWPNFGRLPFDQVETAVRGLLQLLDNDVDYEWLRQHATPRLLSRRYRPGDMERPSLARWNELQLGIGVEVRPFPPHLLAKASRLFDSVRDMAEERYPALYVQAELGKHLGVSLREVKAVQSLLRVTYQGHVAYIAFDEGLYPSEAVFDNDVGPDAEELRQRVHQFRRQVARYTKPLKELC